jgi:hypothetical protein
MDDGSEGSSRTSEEGLTPLQRKLREQASLIGETDAEGHPLPHPHASHEVPLSAMSASALARQHSEPPPPVPESAGGAVQDLSDIGIDLIPMMDVPPAPEPGLGESVAGIPPEPLPIPTPGFAEAAAGLPPVMPPATSPPDAAQRPAAMPAVEFPDPRRPLAPLPRSGPSLPGLAPAVPVPPLAPLIRPMGDQAALEALPPVEDGSGREVTPSDVMPMVADGGKAAAAARGNRRKQGGNLRTIAAVLIVQTLLGVGVLAAMYYSPPFRATVRKFSHRVLGTSAVVAQAEPRWIPLEPPLSPSPIASGDPVNFEKIGNLEENVENIQRILSVTPEAMSEISQLKDRNQLTRLADEAITRGSRSAYMQIVSISESSRDTSQANGAQAELLRVKFFFASGTRSASYILPMTTLYPSVKSKTEEQLTQKELIDLLLDGEKDWRVRRRVAFLLGDKRSYEVAESLAEAIRSDPSLDVIKESVYSFEAITGYRSSDLFEMKELLEWWDAHAVEVKKALG